MATDLDPGTIYDLLDDALCAASCLCGLADNGATVYGTTDPAHADHGSGEAYIVAVACIRPDGSTWPIPPAPYEAVYTITRCKENQ